MFKKSDYKNKSVSELEGWSWESEVPDNESSFVIRNYYKLHKVKLKDYSPADIRFMIGQACCLDYLVPMAIEVLKNNIFIETDFYEGALLENVLKIDKNYWKKNPKIKKVLLQLIEQNKSGLAILDTTDEIRNILEELIISFENSSK